MVLIIIEFYGIDDTNCPSVLARDILLTGTYTDRR